MARKSRAVEMTATGTEKAELDALAEALGYGSRSDVLRRAVNDAFGKTWPVPLFKKPEAEIQPASVNRREARAAKKNLPR